MTSENAAIAAAKEQAETGRAVLCRHCGRAITNDGYLPQMWWHLGGTSTCDVTRAEPRA